MSVAPECNAEFLRAGEIGKLTGAPWMRHARVKPEKDAGWLRIETTAEHLHAFCQWIGQHTDYIFATLLVEVPPGASWSATYVFYGPTEPWLMVSVRLDAADRLLPSMSGLAQGPSYDWHEREASDLFGLKFEGHPRPGKFVLHEDWPENVNPMRPELLAAVRLERGVRVPAWQPETIVSEHGSFAMPIGPIFSDFAEAAHFALETVGEDVIRTIPRFFYKYRGLEKIAEGQSIDRVLLLAERFSGTAAVAHSLGFCQAVEQICPIQVPERAKALRAIFAELERLRHHAATITGICSSTALAIAQSQASLIEEELLRASCEVTGHRYLFGTVVPGGVAIDLDQTARNALEAATSQAVAKLAQLQRQLLYSSSFLDRLEEVGIVSSTAAVSYGLVGPVGRASGIGRDVRKLRPYAAYRWLNIDTALEREGDGYARLRVFFREADISANVILHLLETLPLGRIRTEQCDYTEGAAIAAVEAPSGAAFHCLQLRSDGAVSRYHVTPPAFANWHGFHLAAENFAFQDFPIILATFGLSNAECDR